MPFEIQAVTLQDRDAIPNIILSANWADPFSRIAYPTATFEDRVAGAAARFPCGLLAKNAWHLKTVDSPSGETVAYAKWNLPVDIWEQLRKEQPVEAFTSAQKAQFERNYQNTVDEEDWPIGINKDMTNEMSAAMDKGRQMFPAGKFIMLDNLKTLPSYQRQGVGTMMLKWGIDLANKNGLKICVEATPFGFELYNKFGFNVVAEVTHDLSKWGGPAEYMHRLMVRDPEVTCR